MDSIKKSLYANPINDRKLIRPVAYLTFAVNWYFGQGAVFGYHLINVFIHFASSFLLFLVISLLLKSPKSPYNNSPDVYPIALLSSVLWAIHPIHVQAVTYIVQRMTSLSALFYILGIYFYLKIKNTPSKRNQIMLLFGILISFSLALGTKENTITLPATLFLIEVIFFQDLKEKRTKRVMLWMSFSFVILLAVLGLTVFRDPLLDIFGGYKSRDFTLPQRLLTEPRVLLIYLRQLFLPIDHYFSIVHDVPLSMSLFDPVTTLPAMIIILGLIVFGITQLAIRPFIAFAILVFFIGHSVESTFIPLEIIFEHRNYLPSIFIFLPIAIGIQRLISSQSKYNKSQIKIAAIFLLVLFVSVGIETYNRNKAWATEFGLWNDALKKAPLNARPYQGVAAFYKYRKEYKKALKLYEATLSLPNISSLSRSKTLNNIGNIYRETGRWDLALRFYRNALLSDASNRLARINLATGLVKFGRFDEAMKHADMLARIANDDVRVLNLNGFILYKQQKFDEALIYFHKGIELEPLSQHLLVNLGMTLSRMGCFKNAAFFLNLAVKYHGMKAASYFSAIQNLSIFDKKAELNTMVDRLFTRFSIESIQLALTDASNNQDETVFDPEIVSCAITDRFNEFPHEFE
ncbi:tetratricopeptide repeat protein [Desulfosarcina widdelii]|uniref:tetratricopeptide repeat protein n=1 Tax=Desulfosarcina widdelii TaxID=947919 RepID=UPI001478B738|nr:tetratricopeptide repeat protein [Desulfosarcina widdelii]